MARTKNSLKNIYFGLIEKMISTLTAFFVRSVFLRFLGTEYLGVNSLFSSVLQVLNLAELGFGTAIVYSMYKPIAEQDTKKVSALMALYKRVYRIVGLIVAVIGISIIPFLKYIIKDDIPNGLNLYVIYGIYLFGSVITYWMFAYKTCLLYVNQRKSISDMVTLILDIVKTILQLAVIVLSRNYYLYLIIIPIISILNNLICAIIVNKLYPQYKSEGELDAETKIDIRKRVYGLMIQKVCGITRNSLDSIFLSTFQGFISVAIYNNYYMIMNSITSFLGILTASIIPSIGNSVATESVEKNHKDMMKFNFIYMWISGWCTVCLLCIYQPFMKAWMWEQNLLPMGTVILICFYFYLLKVGDIRSAYSNATGLWYEGRYRAVVETIFNIVLNFVLGKYFGINGIVLATILSLFFINVIWSSNIIYKHYFKGFKVSQFFCTHIIYALVTTVACAVTYYICSFVNIGKYMDIIVRGIICVIVPNIIYLLIYFKTERFNEAVEFGKFILKSRRKSDET